MWLLALYPLLALDIPANFGRVGFLPPNSSTYSLLINPRTSWDRLSYCFHNLKYDTFFAKLLDEALFFFLWKLNLFVKRSLAISASF